VATLWPACRYGLRPCAHVHVRNEFSAMLAGMCMTQLTYIALSIFAAISSTGVVGEKCVTNSPLGSMR